MIKKILCSLIVLFSLLSFSSAYNTHYEFEIPETFILNNSAINSFNNLNFSSEYNGQAMQHVLYIPSGYTPNGRNINFGYFAYYNGKPYLYSSYVFDGNVNSKFEGFVQNICVKSVDDFVVSDNVDCGDWTTNVSAFLNASDFIGGVLYYSNSQQSSSYDPFVYCFRNSEYYYCMGASAYSNSSNFSQLSGSLEVGYLPDDVNRVSWSASPFTKATGPIIPDYEFNEDDIYTNGQIIQGYNAMGLTDDFCYGGFDINNIFEAGTVPQQFTGYKWGSGAFIFDIWDIYSGAYNNDYISFLRSFYISYENNNYSDFYGKTKALYGFINQWFSVSSKGLGFIESTAPTFTLVDVWQYCDLRFNQDPNSIYTGNRRDPKFRYYTSGQVNLGGYFNFSGNNNYFSGNLSGFNTPKDFFASLNSIFQGGLNNLENREPVLPTYIIVFFVAIIFIRIISH